MISSPREPRHNDENVGIIHTGPQQRIPDEHTRHRIKCSGHVQGENNAARVRLRCVATAPREDTVTGVLRDLPYESTSAEHALACFSGCAPDSASPQKMAMKMCFQTLNLLPTRENLALRTVYFNMFERLFRRKLANDSIEFVCVILLSVLLSLMQVIVKALLARNP